MKRTGTWTIGNRSVTYAAAVAALALTLTGTPSLMAKERTLQSVHGKVVKDYQSVRHMDAQAFSTLDPSKVVIFDVREKNEYAVSHLKEAIRIDPDISPRSFMKKYADQIAGKTVIVYCSVGVRSSALAERIDPLLTASGGKHAYNLTGGIFQWHNEGRPLTRGQQSTRYVHPYNRSWGRLLSHKDLISYRPRQ